MQVHFCTFGSEPRFTNTLKKLLAEAEDSGYFDTIRKFNQDDLKLDPSLRAFMARSRGYGFWLWKPMVIAEMLVGSSIGDIVVYADAGCGIVSTGKAREVFREWIHDVCTHPTRRLAFQMSFKEEEYTKADVFEAMGCAEPQYKLTGQHIATFQVLMNTTENKELVANWLKWCSLEDFRLVSDQPSRIPNPPGFQGHRHDQSIFSLLVKKFGASVHPDHWNDPNFPIIALRRREKMSRIQKLSFELAKLQRLLPYQKVYKRPDNGGSAPPVIHRLIKSLELCQ
jgi:hypothetical protein